MIVLLSPAKTLDLATPFSDEPSRPRFAAEAGTLARAAARLGPARLAELMHISPALAKLNADRFKGFAKAEERPAIRMFAGDVYRGFDAASAEPEVLAFAQDHVRILSGLYGILRPLDAMRPYRLEMGTRWAPKGDRLVDHWGRKVARALTADLAEQGSDTLIDLASREYFAVVGPQLPKKHKPRLVTPDFRVATPAGLKFHSFTAKVARGALARFICDEQLADSAGLRHFDRDGWRFDANGSTPAVPLFIRD